MKMTKAVKDYELSCTIDGLSTLTISAYKSSLKIFIRYLGEKELEEITVDDVKQFMGHLRTDYVPRRSGGNEEPLSTASIHRYWKALRSFFKWAEVEHDLPRPDIDIKMPTFTNREIIPLREEEIKALLKACDTIEIDPSDRDVYKIKRPTGQRDKAILLLLLDTGLRAGEFCRLKVEDVNFENGEVYVKPHHVKKTRPRTVFLGRAARKAVWRYLRKREPLRPDDPLFLNRDERDMTISGLRSLFIRMGNRAGVKNVHPHRLRHTFAVQYLKNGGDIFTLQRILGHSTLTMVRRYLALSDMDAMDAHQKASPADRWRL